jgi:hypothetical protein
VTGLRHGAAPQAAPAFKGARAVLHHAVIVVQGTCTYCSVYLKGQLIREALYDRAAAAHTRYVTKLHLSLGSDMTRALHKDEDYGIANPAWLLL